MKFKTITNCCCVCGKKTRQPNPFYICKDCRNLEDTLKRLMMKYIPDQEWGYVGYEFSNDIVTQIFKQILESHMVSTSYIIKMLNEMDKMPEWRKEE